MLRDDGSAVLQEEYEKRGDAWVPVKWGEIPENLISFTLIPRKSENKTSQILVLDPEQVEYDRRTIPKQEVSYGRMVKQELKDKGYLVFTQQNETGPLEEHHLIGVRTKVPQAFFK